MCSMLQEACMKELLVLTAGALVGLWMADCNSGPGLTTAIAVSEGTETLPVPWISSEVGGGVVEACKYQCSGFHMGNDEWWLGARAEHRLSEKSIQYRIGMRAPVTGTL